MTTYCKYDLGYHINVDTKEQTEPQKARAIGSVRDLDQTPEAATVAMFRALEMLYQAGAALSAGEFALALKAIGEADRAVGMASEALTFLVSEAAP
jgi:hypothetical protein